MQQALHLYLPSNLNDDMLILGFNTCNGCVQLREDCLAFVTACDV